MASEKNIKLIGHRGAAGLAFENTLASIEIALALGVDMVEIDVWQTTDSEIVVFHDAYLERLTNESGFIAEMSYEKLQTISLKNGAKIPTLSEVIELIKPYNIPLIVEVKAEKAFAKTLEILETAFDFSEFVVGSFYHQPVLKLKQEKPQLQTAIMLECVPVSLENYLKEVNPDYVIAAIETHNEYLVNTLKNQQRQLFFYTVNLEPEIELAFRAKPDGIITNYPDKFLEKTKQRSGSF